MARLIFLLREGSPILHAIPETPDHPQIVLDLQQNQIRLESTGVMCGEFL